MYAALPEWEARVISGRDRGAHVTEVNMCAGAAVEVELANFFSTSETMKAILEGQTGSAELFIHTL